MTKCKSCRSFVGGTISVGWCKAKEAPRSWSGSLCKDYKRKSEEPLSEIKIRTLDGSEVKEEEALKSLRERRVWRTGNKEA